MSFTFDHFLFYIYSFWLSLTTNDYGLFSFWSSFWSPSPLSWQKSTNLFHFSQLTAFFKNIRTLKSKANSCLCFSLPSIILADLLGNRTLLKRVQKTIVCDLWLVDLWIRFVYFCVSRFVACDLTSNNGRQAKQSVFFLKIRKKSAKRGVPESYAREAREFYTPVGHVRRNVRRLSQSRSPFSASFQTFCFTTRAYFKTPKYGLFSSL